MITAACTCNQCSLLLHSEGLSLGPRWSLKRGNNHWTCPQLGCPPTFLQSHRHCLPDSFLRFGQQQTHRHTNSTAVSRLKVKRGNNHWTCPQLRPPTFLQSPRHCLPDSFLRFGQQQAYIQQTLGVGLETTTGRVHSFVP